jgi:predicted GNAT family N-acyltransferase
MLRVELGDWDALQRWAAPIRTTVFVEEQNVPAEMEIDDWDPQCVHAVAFDSEGMALGTGRLLPDGHIGRMAVLKSARGDGVGSALLTALMDAARARGQREAVPFYERHGYAMCGAEYLDAGIPHVDMKRAL